MTFQQIVDSFLRGDISQSEAEELMQKAWNAAGVAPGQTNADLTKWYEVLRTNPIDKNPGANQGFVLNPRQPTTGPTGELPLSQRPGNVALEGRTDPLTAYLSRLGIGSKQYYNPAESYQASLFDPYKSQYDIQNRLAGIGLPGTLTTQPGSFSEFLNARGGGGMQGLISGAQEQLKRIFGGTSVQKTGVYDPSVGQFGLGYEPGRGAETEAGFTASKMDAGRIAELQQLFKYGLRDQMNQDAAAWAALRIPQAQQAYYGQRAAGQLGGGQIGAGPDNFLDWLKQNWNLQF